MTTKTASPFLPSFKVNAYLKTGLLSLSVVISTCLSLPAVGDDHDIHYICNHSPQRCLAKIDGYLSQEQIESRRWFQYKMYQIDALFQLVKFEQLAKQVEPWVERDDIPLKFKINALIYYAKTLRSKGDNTLAVQYMNTAIATIEQVNTTAYDPMLVVQIANGLNSVGEYQKGYELLLPLVKKYRNRPMAKFKHELFENLGHFALRLGKLEEHLSYRLQALEWAKQLENDNQTAISAYNVARAHQELKNFERAFYYYKVADDLQAMGESDQNMIYYRRAQMSLAMNNIADAKRYFAMINRDINFESYTKLFDELELAIAAVN